MLKLISSVVGLMGVVISVAPNAQAMTTNINPAVGQPAPDLHAQVIFQIGTPVDRPVYYFGWDRDRREREWEHRRFERERERGWEHRQFEREREHRYPQYPRTEDRRDR